MPARWGTVAAYAAVAAANQLLWLTYAPITTATAEHFGVSESAVGWLSQVFPLLYVVLAIPAGLALDRAFRPALLAGAWLTAVGGAVRLGIDTFAAALAGQILIAIAQPLILNAVTKVAVDRAAADERAAGHLARLGGHLRRHRARAPARPGAGRRRVADRRCWSSTCRRGRRGRGDARPDAVALRRRRRALAPAASPGRAELRAVWARSRDPAARRRRVPRLRRLRRADHVAAGAARARRRLATTTAGWLLARDGPRRRRRAPRSLPAPLARRGAERTFLRVAAVVAAAGCALLALAPGAASSPSSRSGVVLLGSLPVILELTERAATGRARDGADLARRQRRRDRRGGARAGHRRATRPRVLAACGNRRARARGRLKEAAARAANTAA